MSERDLDAESAFERVSRPFGGSTRERGLWTRRALPGGWVLALRFMSQGDELVIAELRLFPEVEEGHDPEGGLDIGVAWEGEVDRAEGRPELPAGGISSGLLRELRLSADRHMADRRFASVVQTAETRTGEEVERPSLDLIQRRFWHLEEELGPPRRGRARPDAYYALIAAVYERGLDEEPRRPLLFVEQQLEIPSERIRDALHRARVLGLLSQGSPGRAGGLLTHEGRVALADAVEKRRRRGRRKNNERDD